VGRPNPVRGWSAEHCGDRSAEDGQADRLSTAPRGQAWREKSHGSRRAARSSGDYRIRIGWSVERAGALGWAASKTGAVRLCALGESGSTDQGERRASAGGRPGRGGKRRGLASGGVTRDEASFQVSAETPAMLRCSAAGRRPRRPRRARCTQRAGHHPSARVPWRAIVHFWL
jgi:hypothetical protein